MTRWSALLLGLPLLSPAWAAEAPTGLQADVTFSLGSELAGRSELLRRLATPLAALRLEQLALKSGQRAPDQPIDLASERFTLYVPETAPAKGYALLVFVSPAARSAVPRHWSPVLDRHGMIFVSAGNAGNDADVVERRAPLALLAARNVMARYRVDPERTYVGGISGGSRVAEELALGYPDLFRGALLEAGSNPLGGEVALPPRDLFHRFQDQSRLVYLTGGRDSFHLEEDAHSRSSMADYCVFDIDTESAPNLGHELADAASLDSALTALEQHQGGDVPACRQRLEHEMTAALDQAAALLAAGKTSDAKKLLGETDARFGGLAAPRIIELAERALGAPG